MTNRMRSSVTVLVSAAMGLTMAAGRVSAHGGHDEAAEKAKTIAMVTGEVVDMACFVGEGERGPSHKKCASLCIRRGIPMGILTSDGKLTLMLPDHDKESPYEKLKDLAGETVTVKGERVAKGGTSALIVADVTPPKGWKEPVIASGAGAGAQAPPNGTAGATKKLSAYICSMGCEGSESDKPGKCPVCGMDLVARPTPAPISTEIATAKKPYYCSMDPDVQSDKPGLCPKCGMDLVKRN